MIFFFHTKKEDIEYNQEGDGIDNIPRVKALEMLQELIEDEEEDNQKNMIKIFKKTQLDNIDTDAARNKFNMTSFKKKNEQTEKLYQQMAENSKKALLSAYKDPFIDPDKFARSKGGVKPPNEKVNVFQRLISPEYAKMQEEIQKNRPKQIQLGNVQTTQDKCHDQLKEIFEKKRNYQSTPSIFDSKMTTKKSLQLNTQESMYGQQVFLTQSNYSVPTSAMHRQEPVKIQYPNLAGNSSVYTPQKNIIELSQMSTDQKSMSGKHKLNYRTLSAKQVPNYSPEVYQIQTTPSPQQPRKTHPHRLIQSMSTTNFNKLRERPQSKVQQQLDQLKFRINKLKENKQFSKANKLQMLYNKLEMQEVFQDFVTNCNNEKLESNKQTSFTNHQITNLENEFESDLKDINLLQQGQINVEVKVDNPNFIEFKKRSEFKRKLTNYLIQKVDKKTDVLSKYKQKQFTQNFLQKLQDGSVAVEP